MSNTTSKDKVDEILNSVAPNNFAEYNSGLLPDEEGYSAAKEFFKYEHEEKLKDARTQLDQEYLRRALEVVDSVDDKKYYFPNTSTPSMNSIAGMKLKELRTALTAALTNDKGGK